MRVWPATVGAAATYTRIEEPAARVGAAHVGAIDLHPWPSRTDRPEQPDWAVFDLDPSAGATLGTVIEVARVVRAGLDHLGLTAVCKATGQAGLQIYVPTRGGPSPDEVREWVAGFAAAVERAAPELVTAAWAVARRGPGVRIDTTQNVVGKTLVAAHAPRPRPGARCPHPSAGTRSTGWCRAGTPSPRSRPGSGARGSCSRSPSRGGSGCRASRATWRRR